MGASKLRDPGGSLKVNDSVRGEVALTHHARKSQHSFLEVDMKIGVSGASGHLDRAVVSELLQRPDGHEVVAITRTPETVSRPV
jgi:hypothetical protein